MRRTIVLFGLGAALLIPIACSKKSPPTSPEPSPACTVSPASLDFGSVEAGFLTVPKTFSIRNSGGGTLSGTISESCPDFELVSGAGAYSLGAGQTRFVTARFHPLTAGNKSCAVGTGCAQGVTLTGVASSAACVLDPATLDFGSITVGQSADKNFILYNNGNSTLSGALSESCADFAIVGSPSYTVAAGQNVTFTVRFSPSQAGPSSCTVNTGALGCPQVTCGGSGATVNPACQLDVQGLSFPQVAVGDRDDAPFTLTNGGSSTLSGTVTENCADFSIPGQASYSLAPGQNQTFIVRFTPSQLGAQTCEVRVGAGCPPVSCFGSGVTGCVYQPASFDFGYVRPGDTRCGSLTLTNNTSNLQQGVLRASRTGGNGFAGFIRADGFEISATQPLSYTLNAAESRTFSLCWTTDFTSPCDSILAEWKVYSDVCSTVDATVRGIISRGCACAISPTSLDFGNVIVGDSSPPKYVQAANQSGIDGLSGQIRVISGDFQTNSSYGCCAPNACGLSLAIPVSFQPTRLGPQTGKIVIENLAGCLGPGASAVCDTVTVTGVGVTASPSR
jgi:HYDIN/CFA65/VesB family protein